ncbi:hypothetical protein HanXRQr2_Chr05g0206781 [Helianthus annuus]|uniref:Uncharacterized protein n=1 Tax=Helianthus annuus TaxID=4232 RepID=A0A9K3IYP8_HELAN|nr:hypothetical protein HanXRQr2_Chr05g0206781 [Helianthus annuus]
MVSEWRSLKILHPQTEVPDLVVMAAGFRRRRYRHLFTPELYWLTNKE